ncbi:MAG: sulfite exporter TauE/SafE family protein [Burkholderiales bacterium]|jgi:sulfite exporter TauE/SafE|nr:sulfite exporter TauE/SafE family protein [Burkholderiales bacterium]
MMNTALFEGALWISAFFAGLLGGPHCMMMCGGYVTVLSSPQESAKTESAQWRLQLFAQLGRITSYVLVGTLLGFLGRWTFVYLLEMQRALATLAAIMLLLLAVMVARGSSGFMTLERLGLTLYQKILPRVAAKTRGGNGIGARFMLGLLWGMTPCGLVYGVFPIALLAGGAWQGALVMLAFGLGTLPNLLLASIALQYLRQWLDARWIRYTAAIVIAGFALWGLDKLWLTDKMIRHKDAVITSSVQPAMPGDKKASPHQH